MRRKCFQQWTNVSLHVRTSWLQWGRYEAELCWAEQWDRRRLHVSEDEHCCWIWLVMVSCRLFNVQLCVFSLTGVEAGTSSQPLVSLLERPEHSVEQHLVAGLLRRVQKLPGRHVVVATCSPGHQWGLVHFKVWILCVCQKSYCWLWSFMETRSSSS